MIPESTWLALCPAPLDTDPTLVRLRTVLEHDDFRSSLAESESSERYPHDAIRRLQEAGLADLFTEDDPTTSALRTYHLCALNALTSQMSGSLAIDLGILGLALLPVYLGATPEQLRRVYDRIRAGDVAGLLLTEWEHGSDLLSNTCRATPGRLDDRGRFSETSPDEATHYQLRGEKHLINGGQVANLLVTLVRTGDPIGDPESPFAQAPPFSVLMVERDDTVRSLPAWRTLPAPASDISGVRFEDTLVPGTNLLGRPGQGFALVQQTLTMSRGGIACLAAGAAHRAWTLTLAHARERHLYGAPILSLAPVADHVLRTGVYALLCNALAVKTSAIMNARGQGGAYFTAVAKLTCCDLAERAVAEGRRVLSARALVHELPYAQLIRDVLLYGVFDGTRHVMQGHIQGALRRMRPQRPGTSSIDTLRDIYGTAPRRLVEAIGRRASPWLPPLDEHVRALAGLGGTADLEPLTLLATDAVRLLRGTMALDRWRIDSGLRADWATTLARLEALVALAELGDTGRRAALGMESTPLPHSDAWVELALHLFGAELCGEVRRLADRTGQALDPDTTRVEASWNGRLDTHRSALRELMSPTSTG